MDLPIEPLGCELPNCLASSDHYLALSVDADDEHLTGGVDDVGVQGVELFDLHDAGDLVMSRSISRKLPPVIRMMWR